MRIEQNYMDDIHHKLHCALEWINENDLQLKLEGRWASLVGFVLWYVLISSACAGLENLTLVTLEASSVMKA